jgi:hypothetical protein
MNQNELFKAFHNYMQKSFPAMYNTKIDFEQIGVTLCLMPVIQPDLLENILKNEFGNEGDFPVFGGVRGLQHRGILPTGETWMYFCCDNSTAQRIHFIQSIPAYLSNPSSLLTIETSPEGEPFLSGRLVLSNLFRRMFQNDKLVYEQRFTNLMLGSFLQTGLTLSDLVLTDTILQSIEEIKHWQHFNEDEKNQKIKFTKRVKPGLKILFYGKPGTGKTQIATILGKELGRQVYRIDLSQIVSKYIGETEKNLSKIFDVAEYRGWILFFDEGDALFGKRTSVNSSNDRYANQEVAYLLQRIEDFAGIVILSTNLKDNIDTAFLRRFQIITEFALPDRKQRSQIWQKLLKEMGKGKVNLKEEDYIELSKTELSGGAITNIVNYALLKSSFTKKAIQYNLLKEGIVRELRKENRLTSL